jgi:hypothetical protein
MHPGTFSPELHSAAKIILLCIGISTYEIMQKVKLRMFFMRGTGGNL